MSIQPIDLQVLFSRLNLIGREQTNQKNMLLQAQAVAGSEIAEKSEEGDGRVGQVAPEEAEAEKVADESDSRQSRDERGSDHGDESEAEKEGAGREVFRDPELGQNIDISG